MLKSNKWSDVARYCAEFYSDSERQDTLIIVISQQQKKANAFVSSVFPFVTESVLRSSNNRSVISRAMWDGSRPFIQAIEYRAGEEERLKGLRSKNLLIVALGELSDRAIEVLSGSIPFEIIEIEDMSRSVEKTTL